MSRAGMVVASIITVALLAVGVWQFVLPVDEEVENGSTEQANSVAQGGSFQPPPVGAVSVTGAEVHRGQLVQRITANGVAEAEQLLHVSAEVQGKIEEISVAEGAWVEAGDLLVALDDKELIMARDQAAENLLFRVMAFSNNQIQVGEDATVSSSSADAENALDFLGRHINAQAYRTMMRQPDLEERLSELTREDLFAAQAQLTNNRVALERAELDLQRARIYAPFSGQVAGIETNTGPNAKSWPVVTQQVSGGTPLMMLVDPEPIRVRVEVIESEISFVRQGRRADVTFPAFPGEMFTGTIESIDPVVDAVRKTLSVTVRLPNRDHRLKPGMFAQVVLDTEIYEDRLLVPVDAVLIRDNRELVFVVRNGRAQWEYIQKGLENAEWIEIADGSIQEGEVVITSGHFTLAHDAAVTVVEPDGPGGGG